jgi:hypothetical protein
LEHQWSRSCQCWVRDLAEPDRPKSNNLKATPSRTGLIFCIGFRCKSNSVVSPEIEKTKLVKSYLLVAALWHLSSLKRITSFFLFLRKHWKEVFGDRMVEKLFSLLGG